MISNAVLVLPALPLLEVELVSKPLLVVAPLTPATALVQVTSNAVSLVAQLQPLPPAPTLAHKNPPHLSHLGRMV